ncbi:unnamed protein product, partial [Prorocentrum cordatum]
SPEHTEAAPPVAREDSAEPNAEEPPADVAPYLAAAGRAPASPSGESAKSSSTGRSVDAPSVTAVGDGGPRLLMLPQTRNRLVRELSYINENILGPPARGCQANAAGTVVKTARGMLRQAPASTRAWWRACTQGSASDAGSAAPKPSPKTSMPALRLAKSRWKASSARGRSTSSPSDIDAFDEILTEFAVPRATLTPEMADSARGAALSGGVDATLEQAPVESIVNPNGGEVAASTLGGASAGGMGAAPHLGLLDFVEEPNQDLAAPVPGGAPPGGEVATAGGEGGSPGPSPANIFNELNMRMAESALEGMSAGGGEETEPDQFLAEFVEEQGDLFVRCRMGIFSLDEIIQQAGALEKRYGAIAWRLMYLLRTMPDIISESIPFEWRSAPWRSVGGSGTPLGEMNHASTLLYQRVLKERLECDGGRGLALDAEARRRNDFPEALPDNDNATPDFDAPPPQEGREPAAPEAQVHTTGRCYRHRGLGDADKLPPSFQLKASFDHLERPRAQCAFTAAQVELYHLSRRMTCDQFLREKDMLERMAGGRAALLAWLIWEEGNWRSDFGARAERFLAAVQMMCSTGELDEDDRPATPDPMLPNVSKREWGRSAQRWRDAMARVVDAAPVDAATLAAAERPGVWLEGSAPALRGARVLSQDGNCIVLSYAVLSGDFRGAIDYCRRFPVRRGSTRRYADVAAHFGLSLGFAGLETARQGQHALRPRSYFFHHRRHCRPVAVLPDTDMACVWRGYSRHFVKIAHLARRVELVCGQLLFIDGGWRFPLCAGLRAGGGSDCESEPGPVGDEAREAEAPAVALTQELIRILPSNLAGDSPGQACESAAAAREGAAFAAAPSAPAAPPSGRPSQAGASAADAEEAASAAGPSVPPPLPDDDLANAFEKPGEKPPAHSLTKHLDEHLGRHVGAAKCEVILKYLVDLDWSVDNGMLLQAECVYLYFESKERSLLYHVSHGAWFTWDEQGWTLKDGTKSVMEFMQTGFLKEHIRTAFLEKLVAAVEGKGTVKALMDQCAIFFKLDPVFDTSPDIFQCRNCVLDLAKNCFKESRPSDMTNRSSSVSIPKAWLEDPSQVLPQSIEQRTLVWNSLWSIWQRGEGGFHPGDHYDELGDCDHENFDFFISLVARLLEGRPLQKVVTPFSERGRNGKGLLEKMPESVFGSYCAPVKNTIFLEERRTEDEHNASALDRQGARIAATNEPPEQPWSNSTFKNKVSRDKVPCRGCNSKVVEKHSPTFTFLFSTNGPVRFAVPPKNSEKDGVLVLRMPNKFVGDGEKFTSPRQFRKDPKIEDRAMSEDFGLGFLLILVQRRQKVKDLDELVDRGTKTSRFWVEVVQRRANGRKVPEWEITKEKSQGKKNERFLEVQKVIRNAGRVGATLMWVTSYVSRKKQSQKAVELLPLDVALYDAVISDADAFGAMGSCAYSPFHDSFAQKDGCQAFDATPASARPPTPAHTLAYRVPSVVHVESLAAEAARIASDPGAEPGDRAMCASWRRRAYEEGGELKVGTSCFQWLDEEHSQLEDIGRACAPAPSCQAARRSARACSWGNLPVVEWDFTVAAYSRLLWELRQVAPTEDAGERFVQIARYVASPAVWREKIAEYCGISVDEAKQLLNRLVHPRGRCRPDEEWEPGAGDRGSHVLPCALELRHQLREAIPLIAAKSPRFEPIANMEKAKSAEHPDSTAIALFLQDSENAALGLLLDFQSYHKIQPVCLCFDAVYFVPPPYLLVGDRLRQLAQTASDTMFAAGGVRIKSSRASREQSAQDDASASLAFYQHSLVRRQLAAPMRATRTGVPPEEPPVKRARFFGKRSPRAANEAVYAQCLAAGNNCMPWSLLALSQHLARSQKFLDFAFSSGPHSYADAADAAREFHSLDLMDHVDLQSLEPGGYILHARGDPGHGDPLVISSDEPPVVLLRGAGGAPEPCVVDLAAQRCDVAWAFRGPATDGRDVRSDERLREMAGADDEGEVLLPAVDDEGEGGPSEGEDDKMKEGERAFWESLKRECREYLDLLEGRVALDTCACKKCAFRAFAEKRKLVHHVKTYHTEERGYSACSMDAQFKIARAIFNQRRVCSILHPGALPDDLLSSAAALIRDWCRPPEQVLGVLRRSNELQLVAVWTESGAVLKLKSQAGDARRLGAKVYYTAGFQDLITSIVLRRKFHLATVLQDLVALSAPDNRATLLFGRTALSWRVLKLHKKFQCPAPPEWDIYHGERKPIPEWDKVRPGRVFTDAQWAAYIEKPFTSVREYIGALRRIALMYPSTLTRKDLKGVSVLVHLQRAGSHFYYTQSVSVFRRLHPDVLKSTMRNEAIHRQVKDWGRCVYQCHQERIVLGGKIFGIYKALAHSCKQGTVVLREGWIALLAGALSKGVTPAFASGAPVAIADRAQLRTPIVAASEEGAARRADLRASQRDRAAAQRALDVSRKAKRSR